MRMQKSLGETPDSMGTVEAMIGGVLQQPTEW